MLLDLFGAILGVAQSEASISAEEGLHQVSCLGLNVRRELIIAVHDLLVDAIGVIIVERRVPRQHFKNEDS